MPVTTIYDWRVDGKGPCGVPTQLAGEANEVTPLPTRNEIHYDSGVFERVDWTHGAAHMRAKHTASRQRSRTKRSET